MAEYLADPENATNPRLRVQLTTNGEKLMAEKCRNCAGLVVWNPRGSRWEHLQTWEVPCSDETIKARIRTGQIPDQLRRN